MEGGIDSSVLSLSRITSPFSLPPPFDRDRKVGENEKSAPDKQRERERESERKALTERLLMFAPSGKTLQPPSLLTSTEVVEMEGGGLTALYCSHGRGKLL